MPGTPSEIDTYLTKASAPVPGLFKRLAIIRLIRSVCTNRSRRVSFAAWASRDAELYENHSVHFQNW
jgi:hypothetical protein